MAKQPTTSGPVPYPKNWGKMTRDEKQKWEEENRGKAPRPVVEPIKPAGSRATDARPGPPAAPEWPTSDQDDQDDQDDRQPAGRTVHTAADADAWRAVGADADKIAVALDGLTGREIVAAILRGLASALDAHKPE